MVQLVVGVMRPRQSRSLASSVFFLDVRCALSVSLLRTSLLTNRQGCLRGGAGGVGAAITPCFGPSHFPVLRQGAGCGPLSTLRSRGGGSMYRPHLVPCPHTSQKMETMLSPSLSRRFRCSPTGVSLLCLAWDQRLAMSVAHRRWRFLSGG